MRDDLMCPSCGGKAINVKGDPFVEPLPWPKPWNAHATWNLTLYLPWDRLQESWRLRELSDEDLGPALLQILRSVREVDVRKSTDKFALEITIKSQTDEE